MKDQPLKISIEDDELVIRMGIGTLAFCANERFKELAWNRNESRQKGPKEKPLKVIDDLSFAKDVIAELQRDDEIGATFITDMLDEAEDAAAGNGSIGIKYPKTK